MMLKLLFAGCPATMDAYRARTRRCVGLFAALAALGAATWLFEIGRASCRERV